MYSLVVLMYFLRVETASRYVYVTVCYARTCIISRSEQNKVVIYTFFGRYDRIIGRYGQNQSSYV